MSVPTESLTLEIAQLAQVYDNGVAALHSLDLAVGRGVFGLLGPNGAGKTTLMEILALRRKPSRGQVRFAGFDLLRQPRRIRPILGYLPQNFDFYPTIRVGSALRFFARLAGLSGREGRRRIGDIVERVNLGRLLRRPFRALSGGEKQRFGIAQALINDPKLLIVDEPTVGLDAGERLAFLNLLFELGQGRVVLLSTHIVHDIEATCDKLAVLHHGRLAFHDRAAALVESARGRTWEFDTGVETIDRLADEGRLVSVRESPAGFTARIVAEECPAENARVVEAGLEDAYIRLVGREGRV